METEKQIEVKLMKRLEYYGWFVKKLHGNTFQSGMPDLFVSRKDLGIRLIEIKKPGSWSFTNSQKSTFPLLMASGAPVYLLFGYSDEDIILLSSPPNLVNYLEQLYG